MLWVVTAFTVAHSITLSLAALQIVELPSRLVESAIAASVVLAAANNLWPVVERRRWLVAFGFGLIHGFGFASVLTELGLPKDALVLSLLGFNVGVEIGQLAIVAVLPAGGLPVAKHAAVPQGRVRGRLDSHAAGGARVARGAGVQPEADQRRLTRHEEVRSRRSPQQCFPICAGKPLDARWVGVAWAQRLRVFRTCPRSATEGVRSRRQALP